MIALLEIVCNTSMWYILYMYINAMLLTFTTCNFLTALYWKWYVLHITIWYAMHAIHVLILCIHPIIMQDDYAMLLANFVST